MTAVHPCTSCGESVSECEALGCPDSEWLCPDCFPGSVLYRGEVVQEAPAFTRVDALRWLSFWLGGRYGLTVNDVDPSESVLASFTCPDDVEAYVSQLADKYGLERVQ